MKTTDDESRVSAESLPTGAPGRTLNRQRFLGSLVMAGVTAGGLTRNAFGAIAGGEERTPDGLIKTGIRLGPDGFPFLSIAGSYVGSDGDKILVSADRPTGASSGAAGPAAVVPITLTAATAVAGVDKEVYGDASACKVGDHLNVGTQWDASGGRVAEYVEVNMLAGMAWLTTVGATSVTFKSGYDSSSADEYVAQVTGQTRFDLLDGSHGTLKQFKAGDFVHLVAYMASPQPDPSTAMRLRVMAQSGDASW